LYLEESKKKAEAEQSDKKKEGRKAVSDQIDEPKKKKVRLHSAAARY